MTDEDSPDFDDAIERVHRAVAALLQGDPEPQKRLWSRGDDVTLANPFGGFRRGWPDVEAGLDHAAATFRVGGSVTYEEVTRFAGSQVGYVFQIERFEANLVGRDGPTTGALRVTMIFRMEDRGWKVVHRQADPLTEPQIVDRAFHDPS